MHHGLKEALKNLIAKQDKCNRLFQKFLIEIKKNGTQAAVKLLIRKLKGPNHVQILNTYVYHSPSYTTEVQQAIQSQQYQPLISIIMPVYNVDPKWLKLAIQSIEDQWYSNWELCIADDASNNPETLDYLRSLKSEKIKISYQTENQNISGTSNVALKMAKGEYIVLMDNDDELTQNALSEVVKVINETGAEFIYSDEDKIEMDGSFSDPHFKPDFSPDMFLSQNYLSHLGVIKKTLIDKVDGFTIGLEGAQDYDLYLKVLEHTSKIFHIRKVLYHWRKIPGSTAAVFGDKSYAQEAGRQALENAMHRRQIEANVTNGLTPGTYKVSYNIIGNPLVSIIIPFKDQADILTKCIESILKKSTYKNFEIIGISNNSTKQKTFTEMKRLETLDSRVKFYEYNVPFNYSGINNHAVHKYSKGEHLLFLNNDIEIISKDWIQELLMHSQRKETGAVGARLYFPDDTIQHVGIVIPPYTPHLALLMNSRDQKSSQGYGARAKCINNYMAVTAACLMCKKDLFLKVGGFDAENLKIAYNDIDLCLKFFKAGLFNIYTPYCEAYHHESLSRGYSTSRGEIEKEEQEKLYLKKIHSDLLYNFDPFYNPNLSQWQLGSPVHLKNTTEYKRVTGVPFEEKIIKKVKTTTRLKENLTIFSHFDKDNHIADYVTFYLKSLSTFSDIIFVSTSKSLSDEEIEKIKPFCRDIVVKENYGYDFGSWKSGLNLIGQQLNDYNNLILCNDSVFGPLFNLEDIFKKMSVQKYDIWSMTDNQEICYHLQSFFIVYHRTAFTHKLFTDFWNNFKIYEDKQTLIIENEVKFSNCLINSNLRVGAYFSCKTFSALNTTHYYWRDLIQNHQFPFLKKELLRDNPLSINIKDWDETLRTVSDYDTEMIKKHLQTIAVKKKFLLET